MEQGEAATPGTRDAAARIAPILGSGVGGAGGGLVAEKLIGWKPATASPPPGGPNRVGREGAPDFPPNAEALLWQTLGELQGENFTSIERVECGGTVCLIEFTGGPDLTASDGTVLLMNAFSRRLPMIRAGAFTGRVEVAPGIHRSMITIATHMDVSLESRPETSELRHNRR